MPDSYYEDDHVVIYHGDCLELLPDLVFDVVVTDPPYGLDWKKPPMEKSPKGYEGIRNDKDTYFRDEFLKTIAKDMPVVMFGSPLIQIPANTKQVLVWQKPPDSGLFGCVAGFRRDWEAIYLLGKWPQEGPKRSSIIKTKEGLSSYLKGEAHPHTKPQNLMKQILQTMPEGTILDPFMGSGTTLRAAKDLGRKAIGIEIDEKYCEIAAKRMGQEVLPI